jgi:hypothetical protein
MLLKFCNHTIINTGRLPSIYPLLSAQTRCKTSSNTIAALRHVHLLPLIIYRDPALSLSISSTPTFCGACLEFKSAVNHIKDSSSGYSSYLPRVSSLWHRVLHRATIRGLFSSHPRRLLARYCLFRGRLQTLWSRPGSLGQAKSEGHQGHPRFENTQTEHVYSGLRL